MIQVQVLGIHVDPGTGSTVVLLGEGGEALRVLPIFVGSGDGHGIRGGNQSVEPPGPRTHDTLTQLLDRLHARVTSMVVTELRDDAFHAELGVETPEGSFAILIRPSDGIAIAIRVGVPIHVVTEVLDQAGVELVHVRDTPFTDEEVEAIVSDFRRTLSTATAGDFDRPSAEDQDAIADGVED